MFQILVVDDDKNTRMLLKAVLEAENYTVYTAENGEGALCVMDNNHIDLVVLDIMMPKMDGYEFTKTLRESNNTLPILMVSAKQLPADKKQGFLVGTDDYMTKPIDEEEMLLRIRALLRRAKIASEHKIVVGDAVLDYDALTVSKNGETQELPQKEFMLLYKLLSYPGKIFTRIQLMDEIWGADSETGWEILFINFAITALTVYLLVEKGVLSVASAVVPDAGKPMLFNAALSIPVGILRAAVAVKFSLKPIRNLIDSMDKLASGDFKTRVNVGSIMRRYPVCALCRDHQRSGFIEGVKVGIRLGQELIKRNVALPFTGSANRLIVSIDKEDVLGLFAFSISKENEGTV